MLSTVLTQEKKCAMFEVRKMLGDLVIDSRSALSFGVRVRFNA